MLLDDLMLVEDEEEENEGGFERAGCKTNEMMTKNK